MEPVQRNISECKLDLKVMRLIRPTLIHPVITTCDAKDLPRGLFNSYLRNDVTSVKGSETLASGDFLLVPQHFGNIYLGEMFSTYIRVHNGSTAIMHNVSFNAVLQTDSCKLLVSSTTINGIDLDPEQSLDQVINHEVKEFGPHLFVCEVIYSSGFDSTELLSFKKYFKFEVLKPLDVKTKVYTAETDEIFFEAQVQNITSGPLYIEKLSIEPSELFHVTGECPVSDLQSQEVNVMSPNDIKQYLYFLKPVDPTTSMNTTSIGKLDIAWKSNMGETGRLQTSPLHRSSPNFGEVRLIPVNIPSKIVVEKAFEIKFKIRSVKTLDVVIYFDLVSEFSWCAISGEKLGQISPYSDIYYTLKLVPLQVGLVNLSGIRIVDSHSRRAYQFDNIVQLMVWNTNSFDLD